MNISPDDHGHPGKRKMYPIVFSDIRQEMIHGKTVKYLGVVLDADMTFIPFVIYLALSNIWSQRMISKYLKCFVLLKIVRIHYKNISSY